MDIEAWRKLGSTSDVGSVFVEKEGRWEDEERDEADQAARPPNAELGEPSADSMSALHVMTVNEFGFSHLRSKQREGRPTS